MLKPAAFGLVFSGACAAVSYWIAPAMFQAKGVLLSILLYGAFGLAFAGGHAIQMIYGVICVSFAVLDARGEAQDAHQGAL